VAILGACATGCGCDPDGPCPQSPVVTAGELATFDRIPALGDLDFDAVIPAGDWDYWELRRTFGPASYEVVGGGGPVRKADLDSVTVVSFDSLVPERGFGSACLPGGCSRYFIAVRGDSIGVWASASAARAFLGSIDNGTEAALRVSIDDFRWGGDKDTGAVRTTPDGFELVVTKLVAFCDPVQTNRYWLRVAPDGTVIALAFEVWERADGACI